MGRYYGDSTPTSTEQQTTPVLNSPSVVPGAPPHPLDAEWFLHVEGQVYGPYTGHQLGGFAKEGRVDGASQVMLAGSDKWVRAGEDVRLAQILRPTHAVPTPPPISAAAGATVVQVTNTISPPAMIILDDGSPFGPKSPGVALLLSLLLCGVGQMYCGRVGRGFPDAAWLRSPMGPHARLDHMDLVNYRRLQHRQADESPLSPAHAGDATAMSVPRAQARAEICPNCNAAVNRGALVCGSCGGIIPFERGSRRVKDHLVAILLSLRAAFDDRVRLIWLPVLTPILIGPPLLALFMLFTGRGEKKKPSDPALAGTIAVANVILSIVAWHWLGDRVYSVGPNLWQLLVPFGMGHDPTVRQIPI
jgi:hypothetical protein